jgi:hypothetical protein
MFLGAFISAPYVSQVFILVSVSSWLLATTPGLLATPIMLVDKLQQYKNETGGVV